MILFLTVTQIVIAILLTLVILMQQRGTGLSVTFGGSGGFYTSKRGVEKVLHVATIVLAVLFVLNALSFLFVKPEVNVPTVDVTPTAIETTTQPATDASNGDATQPSAN